MAEKNCSLKKMNVGRGNSKSDDGDMYLNYVSNDTRSVTSGNDVSTEIEKTNHDVENIANICGFSGVQIDELSKEYTPEIVETAKHFLHSCLGAVESAAYLENFKQQLEYYRSLVKKRTSSEEKVVMSHVYQLLLGMSKSNPAKSFDTLLPDYVFLEIIHNHNYVFVAEADVIIKSPNINNVLDYRVDASQFFHICSAKSVKCHVHARMQEQQHDDTLESNIHHVTCNDCRELMSTRRYNTLKVIVTMYLLPLLSEKNNFLKKMIIEKNTGLSQFSMFALAGYMYCTKKRNYLGLNPKDSYKGSLDVYDPPPRTDILMERILKAISTRHNNVSEPSRSWKSKAMTKARQPVITLDEWKSWLHTADYPKEDLSDLSGKIIEESSPSPDCDIPEKPNEPNGTSISSVAAPQAPHNNRKPSAENGNPSKTSVKKSSKSKSIIARTVGHGQKQRSATKVKRTAKANRKSKAKSRKLMCESRGRTIYVDRPGALKDSAGNITKDVVDSDASISSESNSSGDESDGSSDTDANRKESSSGSIPYKLWGEQQYSYNPEHQHEDSKSYYKGYQHLCCLQEEPINKEYPPYQSQTSKLRFQDKAFVIHFGSTNTCEKSSNSSPVAPATTFDLPRFEDQSVNPVVGTKDKALSDDIIQSVLNIANTKPFLEGKANSYVRAATNDPCSGFRVPAFPPHEEYQKDMREQCGWDKMYPAMRIGQREDGSTRVYKGVEATSEEELLLQQVNSFVKEVLGDSIPCDHNMMMMVVSTMDYSFGAHSDHSTWHGKLDENCTYKSKNGVPLPCEKEAFTLTMVITNSRHTKNAIEISWYDKTKADSDHPEGKLLLRVTTTDDFVHMQFPETQTHGIVHAGKSVNNAEAPEIHNPEDILDQNDTNVQDWRILISFRQNVSSSACPACYLKWFDLLNMNRCQLIGASTSDWRSNILQSIQEGQTAPVYQEQNKMTNTDSDLQKSVGTNPFVNANKLL
jgi:hypothetical protein